MYQKIKTMGSRKQQNVKNKHLARKVAKLQNYSKQWKLDNMATYQLQLK
jgi:hypothetical protein